MSETYGEYVDGVVDNGDPVDDTTVAYDEPGTNSIDILPVEDNDENS